MINQTKNYYKTYYTSPVGEFLLVSDGQSLCGLWLGGQKYYAAKLGDKMQCDSNLKIFKKTKDWLERYFNGQKPDLNEIPLAPAGTDFQKKVWKLLCQIPYGSVTTYGELAKKLSEEKKTKYNVCQSSGLGCRAQSYFCNYSLSPGNRSRRKVDRIRRRAKCKS